MTLQIVVFYIVNMYICIFMTCSSPYLYDILMDPCNVYMYVCVCTKCTHWIYCSSLWSYNCMS